jgi:hypothetical protein
VGDKVAVCALVVKRLFPHVKFICDPQIELIWSNDAKSICGLVRAECAPPENIAKTKWWENVRKWVSLQIAILCSSKTTQLKWSFMGQVILEGYDLWYDNTNYAYIATVWLGDIKKRDA